MECSKLRRFIVVREAYHDGEIVETLLEIKACAAGFNEEGTLFFYRKEEMDGGDTFPTVAVFAKGSWEFYFEAGQIKDVTGSKGD